MQQTVDLTRRLHANVRYAVATTMGRKCIAEFIGTYILVFTIGCNYYNNLATTAAYWNFTSIACVLMVSIYAMGSVSGAHFNPAVSFAVTLAGKMEVWDGLTYSLVQTIAGVLGGISYHHLFGFHRHPQLSLGPKEPYTWFETMNAEVIYTSMLCFVVLNVRFASKLQGNHFYGLAVGFVIIAGGYAAGGISGAILNPAVALGIELSSGSFTWSTLYLIYELIGAAIASGLFSFVRPDDHGAPLPLTGVFVYSISERCVSELIGTFYLCVTIGLCAMNNSPALPWAAGATVISLTFSLDTVSGAHFNPALTFAFLIQGKESLNENFEPQKAGSYIFVQAVASISAAVFCKITHLDGSFGFGPGENAVFGWGPVMTTEIIYTFTLCFIVLCVCNGEAGPQSKHGVEDQKARLKEFHGVAIGSVVTASGFAVGAVSGAALNPAVSFGPTVVHMAQGGNLFNGLAFVVFELTGSLLAVYVYNATHTLPEKQ